MTRLSGRLDLLLSQIKRNTDDDHEDMLNNQHLLVFEDAGKASSFFLLLIVWCATLYVTNNPLWFVSPDSLHGSDLESDESSSDDQWEEESEADEPMDVSGDDGDDD